jgi:hypothetical protein
MNTFTSRFDTFTSSFGVVSEVKPFIDDVGRRACIITYYGQLHHCYVTNARAPLQVGDYVWVDGHAHGTLLATLTPGNIVIQSFITGWGIVDEITSQTDGDGNRCYRVRFQSSIYNCYVMNTRVPLKPETKVWVYGHKGITLIATYKGNNDEQGI